MQVHLVCLCLQIYPQCLYLYLHKPSLLVSSSSKEKNPNIWSLLFKRKEENKTVRAFGRQRSHSESHILWRACSYTVVIDSLTRAEWFLSPLRNETFSVLFVPREEKKTSTTEKMHSEGSVRNVFDLNTIWVTSPSVEAALFITATVY